MATLRGLPRIVRRPAYDVAALRLGILHLGCGAFHRAHQALMTQHAIEAERAVNGPASWGIVAASLVRPTTPDALRRQDGLYTVLERSANGIRAEVVGTLRDVLFAPASLSALFAHFTNPAIHVVSLTITAEGYCLDPASGQLFADHPEIQHDLRENSPRSAIGILVDGLSRVRASGRRPPVVLSCDNIAANGHTLRQAACDYAALRNDDGLSDWIARSVQFPCTMVDRVVPVATDADRNDATKLLDGLYDEAAIAAEPFRQWVIERFDGPRPMWEAAGAEFVGNVALWEESKLRLLNGTHMAIAYLGTLAGFETVADFIDQPALADFALQFMLREQAPTLPPSDHDLTAYSQQLLERWRNHAIAHRLDRVGRNGSQKLAPRLLASLRENIAVGRRAPRTVLAIAAWMLCASGRGAQNEPVPGEAKIMERLAQSGGVALGGDAELVDAFLRMEDLFSRDLANHAPFRAELSRAVAALCVVGPVAAIAACME